MDIIEDFGGVWEYDVSYFLKYFSFRNTLDIKTI